MTGYHNCLSGKRCVSRTSDGPALMAKPDALCSGCVRDIARLWDELPHYLTALASFKGYKPLSVGQSKVGGNAPEGSSPLNVAVIDLMDDISGLVATVGDYQVRDLVTLPGGVVTALEIRSAHSRAEAIVGLTRQWQRRRAPCPECGLPTLGGWAGEENIYCTNADCATSLTKGEYEDYCELKAKEK